ncbi:hypothetical protein EFP84_10855 [Leptospira kmetyi]|uniref:Uncharacterized protein n=1 Tax=Leptospira kmetyi TaxID=408139 RepID=A0AAD0UNY4_9LEPT|nr:hypothetical protein EFP84_10855 [Leptospira kmetyi]
MRLVAVGTPTKKLSFLRVSHETFLKGPELPGFLFFKMSFVFKIGSFSERISLKTYSVFEAHP